MEDFERRGAYPYVLSDVADLGSNLLDSVQEAIRRADHVLVVVTVDGSLNSVFEAGLAIGLGKPLLIVAEPGAVLPVDLRSFLTVRGSTNDLEAIRFAVGHAEQRVSRPGKTKSATSKALGSLTDPLSRRARDLTRRMDSNGIEQAALDIVVQAIEASGAVTAEKEKGADSGFDAAVWADDLDAIGANPLLIEVTRSLSTEAAYQVLAALQEAPLARMALIVYIYPEDASSEGLRAAPFPVLAISLVELIVQLKSKSFAEIVRDLRNRSVHGFPRP